MRWLLDHTEGWRLAGLLSPTPWLLGRGEGLEVESVSTDPWFNQSRLCNEASIKTQKDIVPRAGLGNTWRFGESSVPGEGPEAPHPSPTLALRISPPISSWVISFHNTGDLVSKVFLWILWAALASELTLRRGSFKPPIYSRWVRSTGDNRDLWLASVGQVGGGGCSLVRPSPWPVGSDALQRSVSELNWTVGHPAGVAENCLVMVVGTAAHPPPPYKCSKLCSGPSCATLLWPRAL